MANFRTLDLNLLRTFDAVMSEGSLTRAAERLSITQPAASHALKRLTTWMGEPLFQRTATGMQPTARAAQLWPQVRAALQELQRSLAPGAYDPQRDRAEFRLSMADAAAGPLAPAMVAAIEQEQALADLRILPLTTRDPRPLLHAEQADLAIGHFPALLSALLAEGERALLRHRRLHKTGFVCVLRPGHPLAGQPLTLDRYCEAHHLLVSLSGRGHGEVDEALALLGRRRRVVLTVNQYQLAERIVAGSDLVAVMPASFVGPAVATQPLPVEIGPLTVDMVWLARRDADPPHRWLRELVERSARFASAAAAVS